MTQVSLLSPAYARPQGLAPAAAVKPSASAAAPTGATPPVAGNTSTGTKAPGLTGTGSPLSSQTLSGALAAQEDPLAATVDVNDPNNEIYKLITPGDVKLIREATGVNLRVVNNLIMPFDDNGNLVPGEAADQAQTIEANIELARMSGSLVGEIDTGYLKKLFGTLSSAGMALPTDLQDKLMAAVAKRNSAEKAAA